MTVLDPAKKLLCQLIIGEAHPETRRISPNMWEHLGPLARREGLAPLLFHKFQQSGWPTELSPAIRQSFTEAYYASVADNIILFNELDRILKVFQEEAISTLLVKGASLAPSLYLERGLRPMVDVDCLIPHELFTRAAQLLGDLGYAEGLHDQVPGLHEMSDYHAGFKGGPGKRVNFELHWGLVSTPQAWYAAPVSWFWEHTEPWCIDAKARQLTPTAHLIYLSAHLMLQHGGSQLMLIWLCDIHLLVGSGLIAWDELVKEAGQLRWGGVVAQALRLTQEAFATKYPAGILDRLDQRTDPTVDRLVKFKQQFGGVRLLYDWYSLMALRGLPRLRYIIGMIFPQRAYMHWRYKPKPSWLWPLCYPYRWLRMLVGGILALQRGILRAVK